MSDTAEKGNGVSASSATASTAPAHEPPIPRRVVTRVASLSELVGAHPDAIRRIYETGKTADTTELGEMPRGKILAVLPAVDAFFALRPLARLLSGKAMPWKGKAFDLGGNSGRNVVLGKLVLPFRVETGSSIIDGHPTLILRYDDPAHGNPWPVRAIRDELRTVAPGVGIGPFLFEHSGTVHLLGYWGLERV